VAKKEKPNRHSQRPPRPSSLHRLAALPTGPRSLHLRKQPQRTGGPGEPPPGFVTSSTSASEWDCYWALAQVTGTPKDPRIPTSGGLYLGGDNWRYQKPYGDGRGAAIIDFVVYTETEVAAIRIQTFAYHFKTDAFKQATDLAQAQFLGRFFRVVDIMEEDLIRDESGQAAVRAVRAAITEQVALPPLRAGTTQDVR
jgi:hypothetical protein